MFVTYLKLLNLGDISMRYSVIVPVYKSESVLARCIESVLQQTLSDLELILVDDGSQDSSGQICDLYAEKDARVKVIHQKNSGVSSARNRGLEIATGEFICFIDSDDYWNENYLNAADQYKEDLIISGYELENENNQQLLSRKRRKVVVFVKESEKVEALYVDGTFNYVWAKRFKRAIISKSELTFSEDLRLGEDTKFVLDYLAECNSLRVTEDCLYHYVRYKHETLASKPLGYDMIRILESSSEAASVGVCKIIGIRGEDATAYRCAQIYKLYIFELLNKELNFKFIRFFFKQKWYKLSLKYVQHVYADDSALFKKIIRADSAFLFALFYMFQKMRSGGNKNGI